MAATLADAVTSNVGRGATNGGEICSAVCLGVALRSSSRVRGRRLSPRKRKETSPCRIRSMKCITAGRSGAGFHGRQSLVRNNRTNWKVVPKVQASSRQVSEALLFRPGFLYQVQSQADRKKLGCNHSHKAGQKST